MIDIFPFPQQARFVDFDAPTDAAIAWTPPKWASFAFVELLGGGGSGGNGFSRAAGNPGGGGGGGGGGARTRMLMPVAGFYRPYYLRVGMGGRGGSGLASALGMDRQFALVIASAGGGGVGGSGTAIAGGTAGSAGPAGTNNGFATIINSVAGGTGAAGGAQTGGSGASITAINLVNPGGGRPEEALQRPTLPVGPVTQVQQCLGAVLLLGGLLVEGTGEIQRGRKRTFPILLLPAEEGRITPARVGTGEWGQWAQAAVAVEPG